MRRNPLRADELRTKAELLKIAAWTQITEKDRQCTDGIHLETLAERSKLDGCYALKTDLTPPQCATEVVHARYRELTTLCVTEVRVQGQAACNQIPQPHPTLQPLFDLAQVRVPPILPCKGSTAATKKLHVNRKNH